MAIRKRGRDDDDESRISHLPKPILHHVLSFLPQKEAIRTCVLSKSWRYLGPTRPNVVLRQTDFAYGNKKEAIRSCVLPKSRRHLGPTRPNVVPRESDFSCGNREKFLSTLEKTLQTYQEQKLSVQDLHVEMCALDSESSSILVKLVKNMNVMSFRLVLADWRQVHLINELLKALSQSHISLQPSYFLFSFREDYKSFVGEPAVVEHLDFSRCKHLQFPTYLNMLICFFHICRPRYIIGLCSRVTVETRLCGSNIMVKDRSGKYASLAFRQEDLEEIRSEVWDHNAKEWHHVQLGTLAYSTLRALSDKQAVRYRLKWRGGQGMSPS